MLETESEMFRRTYVSKGDNIFLKNNFIIKNGDFVKLSDTCVVLLGRCSDKLVYSKRNVMPDISLIAFVGCTLKTAE